MNSPPRSLLRWTRGRGAALLLALTVLVGGGVRLALQEPTTLHSSDTYHYFLLAENLSAGDGFTSGGSLHPDLSRSPLYPLGVSLLLRFTGGNAEWAARLLSALAGALAVVPLFFLARSMLGPGAALAMLPLASLSPLMGPAVLLLPSSLSTALALAALAAGFAATQRGLTWAAFLAGVLAGATALTRSEGVVWPVLLMAWVLTAPGLRPRPLSKRLVAAATLLGGFLLLYAPYVAWASAHLERFDPAPPMTYLAKMRDLTDRMGLRWIDGGTVPWQQRAQSLLTADHRARVLEEQFSHSRNPTPDSALVDTSFTDLEPDTRAAMSDILRRRANIMVSNSSNLQVAIRYGRFAPAVLVLLALAGLPSLFQPRRRHAALFLLLALAGSLAPVISHVERRFLYVALGLTLLPAAAGWSNLVRMAGRAAPRRQALARGALGAGLLFLVAGAGLGHARALRRPAETLAIQNRTAAAVAAGPAGAILAVQPSVPYRAGRPFRLVPVASPSAVLDYARAQGAGQLVLEGDRDRQVRPDLESLAGPEPPPGFTLLHTLTDPRGGQVMIYAILPPAETTP